MKLKFIGISFCFIAPVTNKAMANDFCQTLGTKLNEQNANHSIVQRIQYNYTVAGKNNYSQAVEYKYDTKTDDNDSNQSFSDENDVDNDHFIQNYFTNQTNHNTTATVKLTGCAEENDAASFSLKRMYPSLKLSNHSENQLPEFNIKFSKMGDHWSVSNVTSNNCVHLISINLTDKFRDYYKSIARNTTEDFYATQLKNMVNNEVCPAHIHSLTSYFTSLIK